MSKIITGFPDLELLRIHVPPPILHGDNCSDEDEKRIDGYVRRWGEACQTLKELWVTGEGILQGFCFGRNVQPAGCGTAEFIRKDGDDFVIVNGLDGAANHIIH